MSVYLARSECRNGVWHVVVYDVSDPNDWQELSTTSTEQRCLEDESPIEIGKFDPPAIDEDESNPCENVSIQASFSWTWPINYDTVDPDDDCKEPDNPQTIAEGFAAARAYFMEVAEIFCGEIGGCPEGQLCSPKKTKPSIEQEKEIVSRIIDGEKDCHLRYRISGLIDCTCKPRKEDGGDGERE